MRFLLSLWLFIIIISSNSIHKIFRYAFLYCSSKNARWLVEKSLKRTNHFACTWIYTPLFMGCGYWVMVRAKNRLFTFQYRKRTWKYDTLMICVIHRRINSIMYLSWWRETLKRGCEVSQPFTCIDVGYVFHFICPLRFFQNLQKI